MSEATFSMKLGINEVNISGTEQFLTEQIPAILNYLKEAPTAGPDPSVPKAAKNVGAAQNLAANSIAAKFGAKSGSDLVLVATYSIIRSGKEQVSRAEILTEMQKAKSYYKSSFGSNLTNYLTTLIKDEKLLEQGSEMYSLSAAALTEIEAKLA